MARLWDSDMHVKPTISSFNLHRVYPICSGLAARVALLLIASITIFLALAPSPTALIASLVSPAQVLLPLFPSFVSPAQAPAVDLIAIVWKSMVPFVALHH